MFGQHLQVLLLLGQLFLQLQELLPLTLLDGVVLGGTLALLEGVTVRPSVGSPVGYKQKEGSSRLARLGRGARVALGHAQSSPGECPRGARQGRAGELEGGLANHGR